MLTPEETAFLTQTGPGTPMGDLFRRYWQPFLLSEELPENDGPAKRVRFLGEDLVAFRDTEGKLGLIDERCPHRGASMYFGINQECGMMCIYHGWKFDVNGDCVDMPSDLPGSAFKDKVHITSYPVIESARVLWTYMGPKEHQPPPPNYIMNTLPDENVMAMRTPIYCNYLQSIEGNLDSTHIGTLHMSYADEIPMDDGTDKPGYPSLPMAIHLRAKYKYARVDVQDTDYGYRLIAVRPTPNGNQHVRINNLAIPVMTWISGMRGVGSIFTHPPIDDENCERIGWQVSRDRPFSAAERQAYKARSMIMDPADPNKRLMRVDNDYMQDRKAQKEVNPPGIYPGPEQDYCVTETMGLVMDRTKEHLYGGDAAIIRLRQMLGKTARDLQEGIEPPGADGSIPYYKIRSEEIIIGPNEDPWLVATDAGETARPGDRLR